MFEPGQIFASRYRIRRCIAEGGMAAIFEAEHLGTERQVALKLLFPHVLSKGSAREKFELEAKISARVNSPYIVQVLDAGIDPETGSPYLAMELLEGETLARRVATSGPLSLERALPFLEQVAAGLDAAHGYREPGGARKPIVHRDLKPENLFLSLAPGGLVSAKILDYGIAKVLDDRLHVSQEVRGTPLFMAVEQITGSSLSPQTDVWAYGLLAHYALTGAHYWRSSRIEDASVHALFAEILTLPLDVPSVRWRELKLALTPSPGFDGWFLRCIEREPGRRFPSAGVAFEALREALGGAARSGSEVELTARAGAAPASPGVASVEAGDSVTHAVRVAREQPTVGAPHGKASSTGSVPAMATTQQRASLALLAARLHPSRWLAAAAGVAVLAGAVAWVIAGSAPPSAPGERSREQASLVEPAPLPSEAAPRAASPAPALVPALDGQSKSLALPPGPPDEPRVRVAPIVEPPVSSSSSSSSVASASEEAPVTRAVAPVPSAGRRSSAGQVASPGGRSSGPAASGANAAEPGRGKRWQTTLTSDAYKMR